MKNSKYIILLLIFMLLVGCNSQKVNKEDSTNANTYKVKEESLSIMVTNEMLKNCLSRVIGEKHIVESIFDTNNKIDEFNFTQDAINNISKEDMFFYFGGEYEPWAENLLSKLQRKSLTLVNLSRGVKHLEGGDKKVNPYYFLSIYNYKTILLNIKNAVQENDTGNKDYYENNFNEAMKRIDEINKKNEDLQKKIKDSIIITSNNKFDYIFEDLKKTTVKAGSIDKEKNQQGYQELVNGIKTEISANKKAFFIYETEEEFKKYESFIKENSLTPIKFIYNSNCIENLINQNIDLLEAAANS